MIGAALSASRRDAAASDARPTDARPADARPIDPRRTTPNGSPRVRAPEAGRVLVVSSDAETRVGLAVLLEADGYQVAAPVGAHEAIAAEHAHRPDLLLLDLTCDAPQAAGLLAAARDERNPAPAVFVVPPGTSERAVSGFIPAADVLVASPCAPDRILRAVRGFLPRDDAAPPGEPSLGRFRCGRVEVNPATGIVMRDGEEMRLPPLTLRLLIALARADGRVVSRRELWRTVWGAERKGPTRALDAHVLCLRRVLEHDPTRPAALMTYNRRGYRLVSERVG